MSFNFLQEILTIESCEILSFGTESTRLSIFLITSLPLSYPVVHSAINRSIDIVASIEWINVFMRCGNWHDYVFEVFGLM